ncbi:MAG: hypothetical protein NTY03_11860, partial [Candidatus Bathyarchaeota archaeon]|nr:hypothetical protein [Candidatus Bathyarchaeota archaeon]
AAYYMVAATGVLVAAVFYILNLRISQKNQELSLKTQELALKSQDQTLETRQAQLFMQLYTTRARSSSGTTQTCAGSTTTRHQRLDSEIQPTEES